jgi:hypothetical protein
MILMFRLLNFVFVCVTRRLCDYDKAARSKKINVGYQMGQVCVYWTQLQYKLFTIMISTLAFSTSS